MISSVKRDPAMLRQIGTRRMTKTFIALESENLPTEVEAFEVLAERRPLPPNTDKDTYLRLCQAVLEDAIDRAEILRIGKPVFWLTPRLGNTNILLDELPSNRSLHSAEDRPLSNSEKHRE
jgi:hypothetical protein